MANGDAGKMCTRLQVQLFECLEDLLLVVPRDQFAAYDVVEVFKTQERCKRPWLAGLVGKTDHSVNLVKHAIRRWDRGPATAVVVHEIMQVRPDAWIEIAGAG